METLTINNRFALPMPEGFRTLTRQEQERFKMPAGGNSLGLISDEGRTMVTVGWKEVNALAGFLLGIISPAASMEANVNRDLVSFGFQKETGLSRQIGGQPAEGLRYTYTAGKDPMVGESYVIRQGRALTFFHVYLPAELREQSLQRWNELLDAVQPL